MMQDQQRVDELQARVESLERRNRELESAAQTERGSRASGRARAATSIILILVSVLLAPIAVLGSWARVQLVDTDSFVATFAPLSRQPEVQSYITDKVVEAIDQNVDIDGLVANVFDGIAALGLPTKASSALMLLKGPTAQGVRSLISEETRTLVASPQFSSLWEHALRETHSRAIAVIQGDPNAVVQLSDQGALTLQLGPLIAGVKQYLVQQGFGFANQIPAIDPGVPLMASNSLALARVVYRSAAALGLWLPWVVLGLLVAGVVVARNRIRALAWAGGSLAASLLLLVAGLGTGRIYFLAQVSPGLMPRATAGVLFGQLTSSISSTLLALIVLSVIISIGAWLAGRSHTARALRTAGGGLFAAVRDAADRNGLGTGSFGAFVERWRYALMSATVAIGVLVVFLVRPIRLGEVIASLVVMAVVLLAIELLRRPAGPPGGLEEPAGQAAAQERHPLEAEDEDAGTIDAPGRG